MLALSLHAFQNVLSLAGRYKVSFLAERLDKMLVGGQNTRNNTTQPVDAHAYCCWCSLPSCAHNTLCMSPLPGIQISGAVWSC